MAVALVAIVSLWIRSYSTMDRWGAVWSRDAGGGIQVWSLTLYSSRAEVELEAETGRTLLPEQPARHFRHDSIPGGVLMFQAIPHGTLAEKLGLRIETGPNGFVAGYLASSANLVLVDAPHWALCTGLMLLLTPRLVGLVRRWARRRRPGRGFPVTAGPEGARA